MDITLYCSLSLDAIHQFNCIMHYIFIFIILHDIVNSYYHYFIHLITVGDKKKHSILLQLPRTFFCSLSIVIQYTLGDIWFNYISLSLLIFV